MGIIPRFEQGNGYNTNFSSYLCNRNAWITFHHFEPAWHDSWLIFLMEGTRCQVPTIAEGLDNGYCTCFFWSMTPFAMDAG